MYFKPEKEAQTGSVGYRVELAEPYALSSVFLTRHKTGYQMPEVWLFMQITQGDWDSGDVLHTHICTI